MTVSEGFKCGLCDEAGMTEAEALAHTCGVPKPVPTLMDEPMGTREAVTVLAVQLSGMTSVIAAIVDGLSMLEDKADALTGQIERLADMLDANDRYNPIYTKEAP